MVTDLIAGEATRSYGFCVVTSAVDAAVSPEVNEMDERFATLRADETVHVPRTVGSV